MRLNRCQLGTVGEKIAARYLVNKGYQIISFNYRESIGEVDLVALDRQGILVFFEVKTRSCQMFGLPQEAINKHKENKLAWLAESFLQEHQNLDIRGMRIDVIAIMLNFSERRARIEHLENVVENTT